MSLRLLLLSMDQIAEARTGATHIEGLAIVDDALPPDFILARSAETIEAGEPWFWRTPRLMVLDEECIVGTIGFKGAPMHGLVEVGYNVAESRRGNGYASAAVALMCAAALEQGGIAGVFAETVAGNVQSRRVLVKSGFVHTGQRETATDGTVDCWLYAAR